MRHEQTFANGYRVAIDTVRGHLTFAGNNGTIGPATTSLGIEGEKKELNILRGAQVTATKTALDIRFTALGLAGRMRFRVQHGVWLTLDTQLTNRSRADVRILHLDFLRLADATGFDFGGVPGNLRLLSNPRGMGYYAGTRDLLPRKRADGYDLGPVRRDGGQAYERWNMSWMMLAIWDKTSRKGAVLGAAQPMHEALQFITDDDAVTGRFFPDARLVAPGRTVHAPQLQINLIDAPREGLEAYARLNQQNLPRDLGAYAGWNSFDYYLNTETLPDILENADAIRADPELKERLKWICVDSGWEYRWGEYVAVEHRFPGGLAKLVEELGKRGFKTGIWTAPLMVERWSTRTTRWDPEVLVRDAEGNFLPVFNDNCFIVDPTHPAGERYLRELYRGLHQAGIRYFKCDFLEMGFAHARHRFKRHLSLTDVNRRVLEIIREAITPDSFLLACIEAPEAAIGIADAIRISGDMHNFWSSAQFSAVNTAWRWWMHGTLIWNDPDMIPVRGRGTADLSHGAYRVERPYQFFKGDSGPVFNRREAELWMAFCLLSGGLLSLCDRLQELTPAGRRILTIAMDNLSQIAAKPIDFYDGGLPALYLQQDQPWTRLGVFNWYDRPRKIRVHTDGLLDIPHGTTLHEIWSGRTRIWKGPFTVSVPAHACLCFRFAAPSATRKVPGAAG
jgi:hypothetical protein